MKNQSFEKALNKFLASNMSSNIYNIGQEPLLFESPIRSIRFNYIGLPSQVDVNHDYLKTNQELREVAGNYVRVTYLDFSALPIFQAVPVYKGEVIYRDSHHIHSAAAIEYAKQALPIIDKVIK